MHECGESLLLNLNPISAQTGIFIEKHPCPLCHSVFQITFEGIIINDEEVSCQVVHVATKPEPKYSISARAG